MSSHKYFFMAITAMIFLTGCYTTMKHPEIVDAENPQYEIPVYYSDNCNSCHQPAENIQPASSKIDIQPRYISKNERWAHFYQNPWWLAPLFTGHPSAGTANSSSGSAPLPTTSSRPRYPGAGTGAGYAGSGTSLIGGGSSGIVKPSQGSTPAGGSTSSGKVRTGGSKKSGRKALRGSGNKSTKNKRPKTTRKKRN